MKIVNTAFNQYLGTCVRCGEYEALSNIEGMCAKCRIEIMEAKRNETKIRS